MAIVGVQALLACDGIGTDATGCGATISTDLGSHDGGETWHTEQLHADVERQESASRAVRLSPLDPRMPTILAAMAQASMIAGRHDEALAIARRAVAETPEFGFGLWQITLALALAGRLEEARAAPERLRWVAPELCRVRAERHLSCYADEAFARRMIEALRAVGLPE